MTVSPLVSVLVTNYNYERYIKQTIESILNQTYKNIELIIIDDGSTDGSMDVINTYKGKAKIIQQKTNRGAVVTRNNALSHVSGDFFIFIDADDTITDTFISKMVNVALKDDLDVVYCDLLLDGLHRRKMSIPDQGIETLVNFSPIPICQLVKSKWIRTHKFDENLNNMLNEDNDFFFSLWADGAKFGKAKEVTYRYFIHKGGRSVVPTDANYYKPRFYILSKYIGRFPEIIDGLANQFAEKEKILVQKDRRIQNQDKELIKKADRIKYIEGSRSYKLGRLLTRPARFLRKKINKQKS